MEINLNDFGSLDLDFGEHNDHSVSIIWRKYSWYQDEVDVQDDSPNFVIAELLLMGWMTVSPLGSFNIGNIPESQRQSLWDRYSLHQRSFSNCVETCINEVRHFSYCKFPEISTLQTFGYIFGDKSRILVSKLIALAKSYDDAIVDFHVDLADSGLSEYFDIPADDIMVISESRNLTLDIPYNNGLLRVSVLGLGSKRLVTWPDTINSEGIDAEDLTNLRTQVDNVNLFFHQIKWVMVQIVNSLNNFTSVMSCRFDIWQHENYKCYQRGVEPVHHYPRLDLSEVDFIFSFTPKTPE